MREELVRLGFAETRTAAEVEAVERARSYFTGYAPPSPQLAPLTDGRLVFMLERKGIEGREADEIAGDLATALEESCGDGT